MTVKRFDKDLMVSNNLEPKTKKDSSGSFYIIFLIILGLLLAWAGIIVYLSV